MSATSNCAEFLDCVRRSGLVEAERLDTFLRQAESGPSPPQSSRQLADALIRDGLLTHFQVEQLLQGKWKNFVISGKYKLLERLGSGGMGTVFLCEHKVMRRRVALKVLPASAAEDPASLERFHREARAVAQLHHPNIVAAHDIDQDGKLHFLVMEYVEGSSFQEIVKRKGPMNPLRAANYIRQAAVGLEHAHEAGLVHRDIKPGNLIVDRGGTVKILDLGLARFFHDETDNLTQKYDETLLGTADYLAPEQILDSHNVDIRADIYSLGITFYFLLTGGSPFKEGSVTQKLIWHQMKQPKPIRDIRPDVPEGLVAVINRMIAKDPPDRYQTPAEVADALAPWTQEPVSPPSEDEMPQISPAARGEPGPTSHRSATMVAPPAGSSSSVSRAADSRSPAPIPAGFPPVSSTGLPGPSHDDAATLGPTGAKAAQGPVTQVLTSPGRGRRLIPAALIAVGVLVAAGVGIGAWRLLSSHKGPAPVGTMAPTTREGETAKVSEPEIAVTRGNNGWRVRAPKYEALVEDDGTMTSLRVGAVEFLKPPGKISRGAFFYLKRQGALPLPSVKQTDDRVLTAESDKASIRYEFGPEAITCQLMNWDTVELKYWVILGPAVTEVMNDQGESAKIPFAHQEKLATERKWPTATFLAGSARLTLRGGTKTWGPWWSQDGGQGHVWEVSLLPHEHRQVVFDAGAALATLPPK